MADVVMNNQGPSFGSPSRADFGDVVDALCSHSDELVRALRPGVCREPLPSRDKIHEVVDTLRAVLFPGYFGASDLTDATVRFHIGAMLDEATNILRDQIHRGFCARCGSEDPGHALCAERARDLIDAFVADLPAVRELLAEDVQAAYIGDPAASGPDEAIFCYPGLYAITSYRIAHSLYRLGVPLIPRIITEQAHSFTGIDIHPGATIGRAFFIDHGTGVVIGETTIIGDRVRLYQGVTLGAKSFPKGKDGVLVKGLPRHPILEDDVVVYSGATILGRVTIGKGSIIGGNVWLDFSVPPGSRVVQAGLGDSDRLRLEQESS